MSTADDYISKVYHTLRAIAARYLSNERVAHTLQPTALVHEAFARLAVQTRAEFSNTAHFQAIASTEMRRVLVDCALARKRLKRGGGRKRESLTIVGAGNDCDRIDVLALNDALFRLAALNEIQCRVVELRFFGGLTERECARVLGIHPSRVQRLWRAARAWLISELGDAGA